MNLSPLKPVPALMGLFSVRKANISTVRRALYRRLLRVFNFFNLKAFGHFLEEEAFADAVGLNPFAINYELRNGTFSGAFNDFFCRTRRSFNVNIGERDIVLLEKALGHTALGTPKG